ncbi:MAG: hypothetical protein HY689_03965 [Chloroflexi bacterium]|nr:hypothetical protein [Chloroflexota bacterium]
MDRREEAVPLEAFKTLVEIVGLHLQEDEIPSYQRAYEVTRAEAAKLRVRDLRTIEPAHTFSPTWSE